MRRIVCSKRQLVFLLGASLLAACASSSAPSDKPRSPGYPQPYHLLPLFGPDNPRLTETAALLARTGNEREIRAASIPLIQMANRIGSDEWRAAQRPLIRYMGGAGAHTRSAEARQLDAWQKRHLVRVYDAMGALGGELVLEHCRAVAGNEGRRLYERQLAQSVVDGRERGPKRGSSNPWAVPGTSAPGAGATTPSTYGGTTTGPAEVTGGTIDNIEQVIAQLRVNFETCYRQALREHGRFGAWIIIEANVGAQGQVTAVRGSGDESVPATMMACLQSIVSQARFAPPRGSSGAKVSIPLSFTVPSEEPPARAPVVAPL